MAYQNYPSTAAEFVHKFPDNMSNTIYSNSIPQSVARASGSRWSVAHLEAFRVILSPPQHPNKHLEILRPYRERARIHIKNSPAISRTLMAVSPKPLGQSSSAELRHIGGPFGAFYSRLAEVARMPPPEPREPSDRRIPRPQDPDFVTGEGLGLSSSIGSRSSQQAQSSPPYVPSESDLVERADHELRKKPETVTAGMAAEFISAILDICSDQPSPISRIEFNPAPTTYTLNVQSFKTTCQDDGSLVRRTKDPESGAWLSKVNPLAIMECKAQYTSWNVDEDIATVSTKVLAQQFCEMIPSIFERIERASDIEKLSRSECQIFLLSVHQSILTFMHWTIEEEYFNYLESDIRPGQMYPFVRLSSSSAFDLERVDQRLEAVYAIMALVYFLDEEDDDDDDQEEEEEGEDEDDDDDDQDEGEIMA